MLVVLLVPELRHHPAALAAKQSHNIIGVSLDAAYFPWSCSRCEIWAISASPRAEQRILSGLGTIWLGTAVGFVRGDPGGMSGRVIGAPLLTLGWQCWG